MRLSSGANIEWQAESEADLDLIAPVNNFAFVDDGDHLRILTTGTHDRSFMKRSAKNFPKRLLNLPGRQTTVCVFLHRQMWRLMQGMVQ
jgi:hypothetical protein